MGDIIGEIIETDADVARLAAELAAVPPRVAHALELTGPLPLRRQKDGFSRVLSAIVSQQVSVAAARAIWGRMEAAKLAGPRKIMWATDDDLRAAGLSRQKVKYARALVEARIDFKALRTLPDAEVIDILTQVSGIGPWTAQIYLMFSLGRADVFADNDLALQEGARMLFDLPHRPKEREMRDIAAQWSPWRAVAARALWAYYHVEKQREGI
jgi:DNA-3-methyladenine glycosylase II